MKSNQDTVNTILKAVALGMSVAVLVLGMLKVTTADTSFAMLSIGLFALALAAFRGSK